MCFWGMLYTVNPFKNIVNRLSAYNVEYYVSLFELPCPAGSSRSINLTINYPCGGRWMFLTDASDNAKKTYQHSVFLC